MLYYDMYVRQLELMEQICACQSYSITGALRLASTFLSRAPPTSAGRVMYVPDPVSPEDLLALKSSGMEIRQFRFLDSRLGGIDWEGLREDLSV
jgi:aspartate aminotransferase